MLWIFRGYREFLLKVLMAIRNEYGTILCGPFLDRGTVVL